jgi:hypothetical protein
MHPISSPTPDLLFIGLCMLCRSTGWEGLYACGNAVDAIGIQPLRYDALATPVKSGHSWP